MAQPNQELASVPDASGTVWTGLNVRPGSVLGNKYSLTRVLGEGGMGVVYEAMHTKLRRPVAVKLPHKGALALPDAIARFEREARATSRIPSPHVAHVFDVDATPDGQPYMVMELLEGRDLERELAARGAMPVREAIDCILQVCAALSAAHRVGIVHLDLKPANLFLAKVGDRTVVKVLDFGIAQASDEEASSERVGTPAYMSPEQARGSDAIDARADIWTLGVILYEMLAGAPPFVGTTTAAIAALVGGATPQPLRARRRDVPEALERVIRRALSAKPEARFPDIDAFAAAITRFGSHDALSGPFSYRPSSPSLPNAAPRTPRARMAGMVLSGAIGTVLLAIAACASDDHPNPIPFEAAAGPSAEVLLARPPAEPEPVKLAHAEEQRHAPREGCPDGYANATCRPPGLSIDIAGSEACCGSRSREALCCAAMGQPCSNELGQSCCGSLRCGPRCVCE